MFRTGIGAAGLAATLAGPLSAGDPPFLTRHPVAQRVMAGHNTLMIGGTSDVTATYAWEANGIRAPGANTTEWLVRNALPGAATTLQFLARNTLAAAEAPVVGEAVSRPARLSVLMPPHSPGIVDLGFADAGIDRADVRVIVALPDGGVLAAGDFTSLHDQPAGRLVRLRPDGTRDPDFVSQPGADDRIRAVVSDGDGWIVGGEFFNFHGQARPRLVRLRSNGEMDPNYRPPPLPNGVVVNALATQQFGSDTFVVAGLSQDPWLIRLKSDGTLDSGFSARLLAAGINGMVSALAVEPDGQIVLGGGFFVPLPPAQAPWPFHRIGRLMPDGQPDVAGFVHGPETGADLEVRTVAVAPGGKIILGGRFNTVHGQARLAAARLLPNGGLDTNFRPDPNGTVNALAVGPAGEIYLAGDFSRINRVSVRAVARLDSTGNNDSAWHAAGFNDVVRALAVGPDGRVFVGGEFSQPHTGVVALRGTAPSVLPRVLTVEDPQSLELGQEGSLVIAAEASAYSTFAWFKDGRPLGLTQLGEWMIPAVTADHAGAYSVVVTNALGSSPPATFTVRVLPRSRGARPLTRLIATGLPAVVPNFGALDSRLPTPPLFVDEIRVTMALDHEDTNDLDIRLIAPNGGTVPLVEVGSVRRGRNFDFTVFAEQAPNHINTAGSPHIGSFRPTGDSFSSLTGEQPEGDWILRVNDTDPDTSIGTLRFFALDLFGPPPTITRDFFLEQPLPAGRAGMAWDRDRRELSIAHWRPASATTLQYDLGSPNLDWSALPRANFRALRFEHDQSAFATFRVPDHSPADACFLRVRWP